eukprot:GAHX01001252.1.p1 GENE.GAHX01001252.1~~GAHX01001252.1.p1  ORF type:complete len:636 (-),score=117.26 GAHX01001252.1:28-1935(-)
MKILHVAEKPSVAKQIALILSNGSFTTRSTASKYNKLFCFSFNLHSQTCEMQITSVLGHINELEFPPDYGDWNRIDPGSLFDASVQKVPKKDMKSVLSNLQTASRDIDQLFLWLDCDREGENIAKDVSMYILQHAVKLRPGDIWRARFSALISQQIFNAIQNPTRINELDATAVDARQEIDLRTGCVFTRYQTLLLRNQLNAGKKVISYGPCQFPTLGFIVRRWDEIHKFKKEDFWLIECVLKLGDTKIFWEQNKLFNKEVVYLIYKSMFTDYTTNNGGFVEPVFNPTLQLKAKVVSVVTSKVKRSRPLPLTTFSLAKIANRIFRFPADKTMLMAEKLYNAGIVSYPRTETDAFPNNFEHRKYLTDLEKISEYKNIVENNFKGNKDCFLEPRKGKSDDSAHTPIYPCGNINKGNFDNDARKLFDLIARHYMACCHKDAEGSNTDIEFEVGYLKERFRLKGLTITYRGFLEIYEKYDKWAANKVPDFEKGKEYELKSCKVVKSNTEPPQLLSEADLITLMERYGIGTDATIHQHIKTIQDRNYTVKNNNRFKPSKLGYSLVKGYESIGINLISPEERGQLEGELRDITANTRNKDDVIRSNITNFKDVYRALKNNENSFTRNIMTYYNDVSLGLPS